jgi:hypothetical protein
MERFPDFVPNSEEERQWTEKYNAISDWTSEEIRNLDKDKRVPYLRAVQLSDLALMNLYIRAYKKEDYETCAAAKVLLLERGFKNIPS